MMSDSVEKEISEPASSDCRRHNSSEIPHINSDNKQSFLSGLQTRSREEDLSRETSMWESKFPSDYELKRDTYEQSTFHKNLESSNGSKMIDEWEAALKYADQDSDMNRPTNERSSGFSKSEEGNESRKQIADGRDVILHEDKEQDIAICKSEGDKDLGRKISDRWGRAVDKNNGLGTSSSKNDGWGTTSSKRDRDRQRTFSGSKPQRRRSRTISPKRSWSRQHRSKSRSPGDNRTQTRTAGGRAAVPCKFYAVGRCKKGRQCSYFHDDTSWLDFDHSLSNFRGSSSRRARYPVNGVHEYFTDSYEEMDYSDLSPVRRRYSDYSALEDEEMYFSGHSSGRRTYSDYSALADEDMNYFSVRQRCSDYSALKDEVTIYSDYSSGRQRHSDYDQFIDLPGRIDDLGNRLFQRTRYVDEDMFRDRRELGHSKSDYDYVKHTRMHGSLYDYRSRRHAERYRTTYDAYSEKYVQGHDILHDDDFVRHGWRSDWLHDGPSHDHRLNNADGYGFSNEKYNRGSTCRSSPYDISYQGRWLSKVDPKMRVFDEIDEDQVIKQRLKHSASEDTSNRNSCGDHSHFDSHNRRRLDLLDGWTSDDSLAGNLDLDKSLSGRLHKQEDLDVVYNSLLKCQSLCSPNGTLYASASSQSLLNEVDELLLPVTSSHANIQNLQVVQPSSTRKLQDPPDTVYVACTQLTEISDVSSIHAESFSNSLSRSGSNESENPMGIEKNVLVGQNCHLGTQRCQSSQSLQSAVEGSESKIDCVAANPLQVNSDSIALGVRDTNDKGSSDFFNNLTMSHRTRGSDEPPKERPLISILKDASEFVPSKPSLDHGLVISQESLVISNCKDHSPSRPFVTADQKKLTKLNCTVPLLSNCSSSVMFSGPSSKSKEENDECNLVEPSVTTALKVKETEAAYKSEENQGHYSSSFKFSNLTSKSEEAIGDCLLVEPNVQTELTMKETEAAYESGRKQGQHAENVDAQACNEDENMLKFKCVLVEFVKDILNPTWKEGHLTKEAYKTIVKKTVDKVTDTLHGADIPQGQDRINGYLLFSKAKLEKLVQAYVQRNLIT